MVSLCHFLSFSGFSRESMGLITVTMRNSMTRHFFSREANSGNVSGNPRSAKEQLKDSRAFLSWSK